MMIHMSNGRATGVAGEAAAQRGSGGEGVADRNSSASLAARPAIMAAFANRMRDLGYIEGRDYVVDRRFAAGGLEPAPPA